MREGWTYKKLGEVAKISSGKAIPSSDIFDTFSEGLYPCYGGNGLRGYVDHYSNDGLIPVIGRVGALCGNVHLPQGKFYATEHALVVYLKTNDKPHFIEYLLSSLNLRQYAKGVAQPVLSASTLSEIPIPVPPISEQQRIVSELDLLSSIIEKKKAQLKEYDQLAQSIFYDMFGDPVTNEKGWELLSIGECCLLKSGNSGANNSSFGSLPYVKVGDMNIVGNETYITTSSTFVNREENKKDIFPIGTTIFPKRGGAILTNKKRITNVEICCDLNIMGIIPNKERMHPLYIYFYFLRIDFSVFSKTGSTIPQINNHNIAPMKIGIPPLSLQQSFACKIESIERQKSLIQQSIKEVQTLFDSRMDYYFN